MSRRSLRRTRPRRAREALVAQGVAAARIRLVERVHLKYEGTDTALTVAFGALAAMLAQFEEAYRKRFSFLMRERRLIVEAVSVEAIGGGDSTTDAAPSFAPRSAELAPAARGAGVFRQHVARRRRFIVRADTRPGDLIDGPAIIAEANATTVVEPGWRAEVTERDHLVLTRVVARPQRQAAGVRDTRVDPVMLEIFNNLFMSIAEQMGLRLQNTAYSVNIKERLDFSCALFDADGSLIANAPHMPVHLGSMSESIKTVMRENAGRMTTGRLLRRQRSVSRRHASARRHRDHAGIRSRRRCDVLFYVGSRGHHADIGGITPGSMPPFSTTLDEEGVLVHQLPASFRAKAWIGPHACAKPSASLNFGRTVSGAQPAAESRRPQGADRGQRKGPRGTAAHGRPVRPGRRAGLHAPRAGQRRGVGAARDHACCMTDAFEYTLDNGAVDPGAR